MATLTGIFEYDPDTGEKLGELNMLGELQGYNGDGSGNYAPLSVGFLGDVTVARVSGPPTLIAAMTARTTSALSWTQFADQSDVPPITSWDVERRQSLDNGASFGAYVSITGSPFAPVTLSKNETGLPTQTSPEVLFGYRVRGVNSVGDGTWSNEKRVQYSSAPLTSPSPISGFQRGVTTTTTAALLWNLPATDATVLKLGLFLGNTLFRDNIGASLTSYNLTGLTANQTLTNLNVRRYNGWSGGTPAGWSVSSNQITFTTPPVNPIAFTMLMGVSDSEWDSGGSINWDGWRCYTEGKRDTLANRAEPNRPLFLQYSKDGANLGGANPTYTAVYNEVFADLNAFYYSTGNTHSTRWGIKLIWLNGNENSDKGALGPTGRNTPGTAVNIPGYIVSQQALYDAVHAEISPGVRRFPDALAGSNPTQEQERVGIVAEWLHPSARYHDIVIWSFYPPGRGVNDATLSRDPRWDWPSFQESQRTNRQQGFLIRGFYRTFQAQAQARIDTGNPNFALEIGCGETGMASDPDDRSTRPYYAVHALAGGMWILANQYGLACTYVCWWDQKTSDTAPHNVLSDEPPNSDHLSLADHSPNPEGDNSVATNPSTRVAWQNWMSYDKRQPGSSQPAQWSGKPGNITNQTGTPV